MKFGLPSDAKDFVVPRLRNHEYEIGAIRDLGARISGRQLNFSTADPMFDTPVHIKRAMTKALRRPEASHYCRIRGLPEFVSAVSEFYARFDIAADPSNEVTATAGVGEALYIVLSSITAPGDQFILPNPTFPNYASILKLQGGTPRFVPVHSNFHLNLEAIRKNVTSKTKGIVICAPNNPTGAVYTKEELADVLEIARKNNLLIMSDESYSLVTYDSRKHVSIGSLQGGMERTIIVNGLSKVFAMTGWRLGYIIARKELTEQFEKLAFEMRGSVNTAVQYAGVAALRTPKRILRRLVKEYDRRRKLAVQLLLAAGLRCHYPEGGFETFPRIPTAFRHSIEFAKFLAEKAGVLVKPGLYFGPEGDSYFRLVFCKDESLIVEGVDRIKSALDSLITKEGYGRA